MGEFIKEATKKVFYVITMGGSYTVDSYTGLRPYNVGFGFGPLSEATKYPTVAKALERLSNAHAAGNWGIVRVEETPGSEERVVLGETQEAPAGSVVKYAVRQDQTGNPFFAGGSFAETVQGARLYSSQADALAGIIGNYTAPYRLSLHPTTVLRVAVQPSAPKYTETVLA